MGFVNAFLGANQGSDQGIQAVQNPVTVGQATQAYDNTQSGLAQQQAFTAALGGQNGIGNQNSVFAQQQALSNQLQNQANGQGPNPALAQLAQTTGQNISSQNALMAGQRGGSANAGLIARQAAMQGANTQQQAVGQAATLSAQQQIAAEQALQGQQANMANLATNQVGQQANSIQAYNQGAQNQQSNLLGANNSQNQVNEAAQAQNATNNAKLGGMLLGSAGSVLSAYKGGEVPQMYADGGNVGQQISNGFNNATALGQQPPPPPPPKNYADGGAVQVTNGPSSFAGQYLRGGAGGTAYNAPNQGNTSYNDQDLNRARQGVIDKFKSLGQSVPGAQGAIGAGGEAGAAGGAATGAASGAAAGAVGAGAAEGAAAGIGSAIAEAAPLALAAAHGGLIHGERYAHSMKPVPGKAEKNGDSLSNDKVKALLSPGEIILPRSVTQSDDPVGNAAKFVAGVMAKKGRRK